MSFILDALKKSENERQRQIGPSLADIPLRRARSERPWWAVAVAGLLVVNLGVLIAVLARNRSVDPQQAQVQTQPQPQTVQQAPATSLAARPAQTAPVVATPPSMSPSVRSLADEAGADTYSNEGALDAGAANPDLAGASLVPAGPPVVRAITPPAVAPLPNQATFGARERERAAQEEVLPTNYSLIANGTNLPEMRLDIHVYSAKPAERFVFVNMRKYLEGQSLAEGPMLERITPDGAILNQHGTRFLLPRQ